MPRLRYDLPRLLPGIALCVAVSLASWVLQRVEEASTGRAWLEALVIAILLGAVLRTLWSPGPRWRPGIRFSGKTLLEVAVALLGASISVQALETAGPFLLAGIAGVVAASIAASYGIGRALGLPHRLSMLVACGNSICGNSAIAAVAPVIGADGDDIASAIAFTAILGVVMVLGLPLLVPPLGLSETQYGVLAGLTVYAVPQVLAATVPVGVLSVQVGTLVKLVRVLMLGPVVVLLSLGTARAAGAGERPGLGRMVPWFILAFLGLAALRALGLVPDAVLGPVEWVASALTIIAMAALGLGVDVRVLGRVGGRVTLAATLALLLLGTVSLGLIHALGIA